MTDSPDTTEKIVHLPTNGGSDGDDGARNARKNVIPFQAPLAKTVLPDRAGPFAFTVFAKTDIIGRDKFGAQYRDEKVLVDPDAELEDGCLIITQFKHGTPSMVSWRRTGRDVHGRFVRTGDPHEAYLCGGRWRYDDSDLQSGSVRILGRVIGPPRQEPVLG